MIDEETLAILRCPEGRMPLRVADKDLLDRVNAAIADGKVVNRGGQAVSQPINGGLVREDGAVLYPIVDEIPVLLVEEAVALDQLDRSA